MAFIGLLLMLFGFILGLGALFHIIVTLGVTASMLCTLGIGVSVFMCIVGAAIIVES
jgi:hypothetical protein